MLAGVGFILPAATITLFFAWLYGRYGSTPGGENFMLAIKPVVIAVVIQAIVGLLRAVPRTISSFLIIALAAGLFLAGVNELLILFGGESPFSPPGEHGRSGRFARAVDRSIPAANWQSIESDHPGSLSLISEDRIGAVWIRLCLARVSSGRVRRPAWLAHRAAIARCGRRRPGDAGTGLLHRYFAGYLMGSWSGAIAATIGIFLPAFIFVFLTHGLVHWSRKGETTSALLDGLNLAALGLMAGAAWILGRDAIVSVWTLAIAIVALIALVRFRVNSTWLVLGAAIVGLINAATGFI